MKSTLSVRPCGSEAIFTVTTFTSQTSLRVDNVLCLYEGQLELNLFHNQAGLAPGKGTSAERQETRTSWMIPYSHGDALSAMSQANGIYTQHVTEGGMGIK